MFNIKYIFIQPLSVQLLSHVRLFVTPWTACSTPGLPVHRQLPEFTRAQVYRVRDAIQPSHPLLSTSSAFNLSEHQGPLQWSSPMSRVFASGGQSNGVSLLASVLPMNIRGWFPLGLTGLISLQSKGLSRVLSSTTVQKHQSFDAQLTL